VDLTWFAPGHGFLMANPHKALEGIVAHRLRREAKVLEAVNELAGADTDALLARVYDDVKPGLHPVARRSLTAHLEKLAADGRVRHDNGRWTAAA